MIHDLESHVTRPILASNKGKGKEVSAGMKRKQPPAKVVEPAVGRLDHDIITLTSEFYGSLNDSKLSMGCRG